VPAFTKPASRRRSDRWRRYAGSHNPIARNAIVSVPSTPIITEELT